MTADDDWHEESWKETQWQMKQRLHGCRIRKPHPGGTGDDEKNIQQAKYVPCRIKASPCDPIRAHGDE